MGLLSNGRPLTWEETKKYSNHVKENAIQQLINNFERLKDRKQDCLLWGDEIEYILVDIDRENETCRVSPRAEEIMSKLQFEYKENVKDHENCSRNQRSFVGLWHPEYARFMLEGVPKKPYKHEIKDLLCVEGNMRARRIQANKYLRSNEMLLTIGNFPRLGCPDSFIKSSSFTSYAKSLFFPDEYINTHNRFKTLTDNTYRRRGRKISHNIPIYQDRNTFKAKEILEKEILLPENLKYTPDWNTDSIHMDAFGLGMGCGCLQVTFQAPHLSQARRLYDQLAVICPIIMSLSAATPIYRGILSDVDCRWDLISASVDDRTKEECDPSNELYMPRSRYSSVARYIFNDKYNDVNIPYYKECYSKLLAAGFDELLARHFGWLFKREPLVIHKELLDQDNVNSTDHFENIQTTNWHSMRFKPPPPSDPNIGWRVEFRPAEIQFSDFDNAAFAIFIVLLSRVILSNEIDLYIPISDLDKNMEVSQLRNSVIDGKFYFRKNVNNSNDPSIIIMMSIDEIINGSDEHEFPGLLKIIKDFLSLLNLDRQTFILLEKYLDLIKGRANGSIETPALWMRNFVLQHPEYGHDSIVTKKITYDMLLAIDCLAKSQIVESTSISII